MGSAGVGISDDQVVADRSTVPLYAVAEAARYARAHPRTLKNWAAGYEVGGRRYPPLLVLPPEEAEPLLSFENLIEAALITAWRRRGISLQRIRRAHALAIGQFGDHPFARQEVYVAGTDLFVEADRAQGEGANGRTFTVITQHGQAALAAPVASYLESIDWRSGTGTPYQWRPPEGNNVVRLNPEITFGLPNVRRVRTETILTRFLAHETVEEIASDFDLDRREVEEALRYEWSLTKAA